MKLVIPKTYRPKLDVRRTELAIQFTRELFQEKLANALNLERASAPLFVPRKSGLNDDLNGTERAVSFDIPDAQNGDVVIVHSLAKWKRDALRRYGYRPGEGIWTNMNAIRRDEELGNMHSAYVDQWDWERVISAGDRNIRFLHEVVRNIFAAIKATELEIHDRFSLTPHLPDNLQFITAIDLEEQYPNLTPKERENKVAREMGAVFISGIGAVLPISGVTHDGRAPDYDDWATEWTDNKGKQQQGLNGDIVVWNPILECAFELSSMGIRVNPVSLVRQLMIRDAMDRRQLPFHRMLIESELPLSIGGGIGQSRLCMLLLQKAHIGEVHASIWPPEMIQKLTEAGIQLL
ncbi:MAG: aspartate--ammonia ligase [Candidatus Micrarchaeota archaeon]